MSMNETYQPINCDDYDSLELACMHHLILTLTLKDGEVLQAKANDLILRKNVEYLLA
ncbi:Rho-binding antiterminator, partial [Salmonella enterica subsp. enterica]|nr:Rho-binding antiterminator [Salmonella enterica subsp. enterica serovar Chester]